MLLLKLHLLLISVDISVRNRVYILFALIERRIFILIFRKIDMNIGTHVTLVQQYLCLYQDSRGCSFL